MTEATPEIITDWRGTHVMIPVRYGIVRVVWTRAGHAHASTDSGGTGTRLAYRDRDWYASMHLWAEHGWGEDPADPHPPVFTSYDAARGKLREIPPTHRAAIVAEVVAAVAAFAEAHPEIPAQAEAEYFSAGVSRAEKAADEASAAYESAIERKHEMARELRRAQEHLASLAGNPEPGGEAAR